MNEKKIHKSVQIKDSTIGKKVEIREFCSIRESRIGANCEIMERTSLKRCVIEDQAEINSGCYLENVVVGKRTMIGPNCSIVGVTHDYSKENGISLANKFISVIIGPNCWLGASVTIMPGVHIGEGAIIAAGSLVNVNVPAFHKFFGRPENHRIIPIG